MNRVKTSFTLLFEEFIDTMHDAKACTPKLRKKFGREVEELFRQRGRLTKATKNEFQNVHFVADEFSHIDGRCDLYGISTWFDLKSTLKEVAAEASTSFSFWLTVSAQQYDHFEKSSKENTSARFGWLRFYDDDNSLKLLDHRQHTFKGRYVDKYDSNKVKVRMAFKRDAILKEYFDVLDVDEREAINTRLFEELKKHTSCTSTQCFMQ